MIGKLLGLLAVPLAYVAYSSYAKASPKTGPRFEVKGKSGTNWTVVNVSKFQEKDGLLSMNDVFQGNDRALRYSQLGSQMGTRKYITSPFEAGTTNAPGMDRLVMLASKDFGVVLPKQVLAKFRASTIAEMNGAK